MKKICGLLFIVFMMNLKAESVLALLKGIENNHTLHMTYKMHAFICKPYGVETVSELLQRTDVNSSCMGYLLDFRMSDPKEKSFAHSLLHIQQQYSVEGISDLCLLHLSSGNSYSEALLEKGYARIPPAQLFEDEILRYRFKQAVKRAKVTKAGLWSDVNAKNCFLSTKIKEK